MATHQAQLVGLRQEVAARNALPSGQDILAEWKLAEGFIGEMAVALVDAALETCELYQVPLDMALSSCIEKAVESYTATQFRHALRNRQLRNSMNTHLPDNMKSALAGRISSASFHILNPVQIRLEKARVTAERLASERKSKETNQPMSVEINAAEQAVLLALRESYPTKIHVHPLAQKVAPALDFQAVLRAVDGLHTRGLVDCVLLKDFSGLQDAANIVLTAAGVRSLQQPVSETDVPAKVTVLNVLISSPSDVLAEREAVEEAIQEWNANHYKSSGIMLHAVRWETHAYPAMGDRPQGILNKQIVQSAHFLIGIFGTRIGTPTGVAPSGTIEEIEEIRKSGKHVALYFSNAPVPRDIDRSQLDALEAYQRSLQDQGVYFKFGSAEELRRMVTSHLPKIVREVEEGLRNGGLPAAAPAEPQAQPVRIQRTFRRQANLELNPKEMELLWEAARSSDGQLYHSRTLNGEGIRANQRHFLSGVDPRTASEWLSALRGLEEYGLIEALSENHDFFRVTGEGYAEADKLEDFTRWETSSIMLRAYYMNADTQEQSVECKSVVALPAVYYPDQVSADGFVSRSEKEPRSLLIEGVRANPSLKWMPTDVEFTDEATKKIETYRVQRMEFIRPDRLKLSIA